MAFPEITIWGGHLDDPPKFAMPLIRAYGLAVMNWGRLEQHLDMALISINKKEFTADPMMETPTSSFRLKLELFKKWYVKDARLAKHRTYSRKLIAALKIANTDRQILVHCNLQRFEEGPPPVMVMVQITHKRETTKVVEYKWTEERLLKFSNAIHKLNTGFRVISSQTMTQDFLESLESTRSRHPIQRLLSRLRWHSIPGALTPQRGRGSSRRAKRDRER